jgi:CRP-like cAMP-binding protein
LINDKKVILGNVESGEFVGEMAYINNEPRSATIEATSNAQLIEVPIELVDKILYKRPAWSKALMQTLSKRLKNANKAAGTF